MENKHPTHYTPIKHDFRFIFNITCKNSDKVRNFYNLVTADLDD